MSDKVVASFSDNCWDLDAYKYLIRKEYLLSKLTFNFLIMLMGIVFVVIDFSKGDYKTAIIVLGLVFAYIGMFIFLYFYKSNKFIKELKMNIKSVNVEFYENRLFVNQKSKTDNIKTNFSYKDVYRIYDKGDYFFLKFKDISLPFNKKKLNYNESSFDDIIKCITKCIEVEEEKRLNNKKK